MSLLITRGRHTRRRPVRAAVAGLAGALSIGSLTVMVGVAPAEAVTNAVSTTTNVGYSGADAGNGACLNGNTAGGTADVVNCNHYTDKRDVWLSNLPSTLADGTYFFAVLAPGGQQDPNDGTPGNLSDDFDASTNRAFTQTGGSVSGTSGTHHVFAGKIQLWRYADTPNPGGVYILAVCAGDGSQAVDPSDCKYDAFKVDESEEPPCDTSDPYNECPPPCPDPDPYTGECPPPVTELDPLTVLKDADGTYDNTFTWSVDKTAGTPTWSGSTATVPYTVTLSHSSGTKSNFAATGKITVFNPNPVSVSSVSVSDTLTIHRAAGGSSTVTCTVTSADSSGDVAEAGDSFYPYSCGGFTLAPGDTVDNTVTASWDDNVPGPGFDYFLPAGSTDFIFDGVGFTGNDIDECVAVGDVFDGGSSQSLDGSLCVGDPAGDFVINLSKQKVVESGCVSVTNTGTFVTNDTRTPGSDPVTTRLCRPYASTSGHTMGFWQNSNGQAVIGSMNCTDLSTWLKTYNPFTDLSSATCTGIKTYVTNVIKAANSSGAVMNAMLKGQALATALSVYATSHVNPTVRKYFGANPVNLGTVSVDLNPVCANPSICTSFIDARAAFGGAESLTVSQALAVAASQATAGGTPWYAQVKLTQEKAKDVFDAINNNVIYAP